MPFFSTRRGWRMQDHNPWSATEPKYRSHSSRVRVRFSGSGPFDPASGVVRLPGELELEVPRRASAARTWSIWPRLTCVQRLHGVGRVFPLPVVWANRADLVHQRDRLRTFRRIEDRKAMPSAIAFCRSGGRAEKVEDLRRRGHAAGTILDTCLPSGGDLACQRLRASSAGSTRRRPENRGLNERRHYA